MQVQRHPPDTGHPRLPGILASPGRLPPRYLWSFLAPPPPPRGVVQGTRTYQDKEQKSWGKEAKSHLHSGVGPSSFAPLKFQIPVCGQSPKLSHNIGPQPLTKLQSRQPAGPGLARPYRFPWQHSSPGGGVLGWLGSARPSLQTGTTPRDRDPRLPSERTALFLELGSVACWYQQQISGKPPPCSGHLLSPLNS